METLARFFIIPNFKNIQKELYTLVTPNMLTDSTLGFTISNQDFSEKVPTLKQWFLKTFDQQPISHRLYVTAPHNNLKHHIDGFKNLPIAYSLNIPVYNCNNTEHIFWECDDSNKLSGSNDESSYRSKQGAKYVVAKDVNKLKKIISYELTNPCFFRNDVMHSVENPTSDHRIVFAVRWELSPIKYRKITDVVDESKINWI